MENIKERALKVANKKIAFVGSVNENNVPNIKAMSVARYFILSQAIPRLRRNTISVILTLVCILTTDRFIKNLCWKA